MIHQMPKSFILQFRLVCLFQYSGLRAKPVFENSPAISTAIVQYKCLAYDEVKVYVTVDQDDAKSLLGCSMLFILLYYFKYCLICFLKRVPQSKSPEKEIFLQ